jgi:opacity protein-like surface antigen
VTGVASFDMLYHHFPKKLRGNVAPFVNGGYTPFFGHNTHEGPRFSYATNGFNVGGGIDVFATDHISVRFDTRYYGHGGRILNWVYPDVQQFSFVAFRIGVTFG